MGQEPETNLTIDESTKEVDATVFPCDEINITYVPEEVSGYAMIAFIFGHKGKQAAFPIQLEIAEAVHAKLGQVIGYLRAQRDRREGKAAKEIPTVN